MASSMMLGREKQSASFFIYCNLLWRYVDVVLDSAWFLDPVLGPPKIALVDSYASKFQRARFKVTTAVCVCGNQSTKLHSFRAVR